mgnify:CR=1 FL=1
MKQASLLAALILNAGVLEAVSIPTAHLGVYPFAAIGVAVPIEDTPLTLVPQFGVEVSPEFSTWGFTGTLTTDIRISDRVGLDFNLAFVHDQYKSAWDKCLYFGGIGTGVSIFVDKLTISPFINIFAGLNVNGHVLTPGVNFGWEL